MESLIEEIQELTSLTAAYLLLSSHFHKIRIPESQDQESLKPWQKEIATMVINVEVLVGARDEIPTVVKDPSRVDWWFRLINNSIERMRMVTEHAMAIERNNPDERVEEVALLNNAVVELTARYDVLCEEREKFRKN